LSSETPYSRLLDWVAAEVCPDAAAAIQAGHRTMAQAVQQSPDVRQHVCGLECHHDGSDRFDFFLACLSNFCSFNGLLMPSWWEHLLAMCDPIDRDYALQGGLFAENLIGQLGKTKSDQQTCSVVLPDAHSLEFDYNRQGSRLAGVFQWIYPPTQVGRCLVPDPEVWSQTWDRLPLGGAVGQSSAWCVGLMEQVRSLLGWPLWAGFMCGRGDMLKLGFRYDAQMGERLHTFFVGKGLDDEARKYLEALTGCVRDPGDELRVSLDLDLGRQRLLPALAFEYYPASVIAETQDWQALDRLASPFNLNASAVADARRKLGRLPCGSRSGAIGMALQRLLPALPLSVARAAKLSHYKLSLLPDASWKLKSYLSFTWINLAPSMHNEDSLL
jgi:hypothetical protein